MKKIIILFSVLLLILCFAACKGDDVYLSEIDSSVPDLSSGFEIIITDDKTDTASDTSSEYTQSQLDQIAKDWEDMTVEIEVSSTQSKTDISSSQVSSEEKTSSAVGTSKPSLSSSAPQNSSEPKQSSSETSSAEELSSSSEPTSSKVTSLPDYYEGRY